MTEIEQIIYNEMKRIAHYIVNCNNVKLLEYYKGVLNGMQTALEILQEKKENKKL